MRADRSPYICLEIGAGDGGVCCCCCDRGSLRMIIRYFFMVGSYVRVYRLARRHHGDARRPQSWTGVARFSSPGVARS